MNLNSHALRARGPLVFAFVLPVLLLLGLWVAWQTMTPAAVQAQETSVITSPTSGATVNGVVPVLGTATDETFQRYELHYKPSNAPASDYIYFADGIRAVVDAQLGLWDTTSLAAGSYDLRLRVVRTDGNYTEYFVENLEVDPAAQAPTEEPTAVVTATVEATATMTPTVEVTPTAEVTATATVTSTPIVTPTDQASPTATVIVTATPTATTTTPPTGAAQIVTQRTINVRGGPGTNYPIVATLQTGQSAPILGRNQAGDWWQIQVNATQGWVLASIVTAQNAGNVPVVTAPPVPATTPVTPTTQVTTTAQVTQTTATTGTQAGEVEEGAQVSISVAGNVAADAALTRFVRILLAGFGTEEAVITATIGGVPVDFPIDITLPATVTVIGGVSRAGEFGGSQLFLSAEGNTNDLVTTVSEQLVDAGYTVAAQEDAAGPGEIFTSSSPFGAPVLLCGPDLVVNINAVILADEADVVVLNVSTAAGFGGPCGVEGDGAEDNVFAVLPSLAPPAQAEVRGRGSSTSTGVDGFSISAEAEIETTQPVSALAAHYEAQLEEAGWARVADSATEDVSWSAWTFSDNGNEWRATFYIVRRSGDAGDFLATLHAETE